ncbi:heat shock protein beta-9 [Puntigrus tetrazona]|uniref:heat shock protein beta-9 n=1 Tax=Puntigrus tetrazona TaxID=1606681 RepID=UPI001C8A38B2|nr:heat shock protein beta-9 [Puntigrus tetrazona]
MPVGEIYKLEGPEDQTDHSSESTDKTSRQHRPDKQTREMSSVESLFMDDPFFDNSHFLWPRRSVALSSFREDFVHRRAQIMQNLKNEIRGSLQNDLTDEFFQCLEGQRSFSRLFSTNTEQNKRRDVSLTLDTQGFSPEDVTVTVSGRHLKVMAGKQAQTDASSSSTGNAQVAEAQPQEFVQAVRLPDHLDPTSLTCSLGEDGLLHIESPESKDESSEEQIIPIRFRTSLDFPINKDSANKKEDEAKN